MNLREIKTRTEAINEIIKGLGLSEGAYVHIPGYEYTVTLSVRARDRSLQEGEHSFEKWERSKSFGGEIEDLPELFNQAVAWALNLPTPERRQADVAIKTLARAKESLPETFPAFEVVRAALQGEIDRLSRNALTHG